MFSGCTVPPDSKETELGSSNQESSPLAGKNNGIVLVSCHTWKCVPTAISSGVDIFEDHHNNFKDWCFMNSQPIFLFPTNF